MHTKLTVIARFFVIALACLTQTLCAQSITAIAHIAGADIINAGSIFNPLTDRIQDLDPSTFSLTFINKTVPRQDVQAVMHLETYAALEEDGISMLLYTLESQKPFLIPKEGRVFTAADSHGLNDMQFNTSSNDANIQKLKDKIRDPASGGKVPSGKYNISITVTVVKIGAQEVREPMTVQVDPVIVSNPTVAALIIPSENGYQYPTVFPQFQWTYDTRGVRLTVYEKRADQQSLEDATRSSDPNLQVEIDKQISHGKSIFTYPQSASAAPGIEIKKGPRPLEAGKTYVLVLEGIREAFATTADPLRTIRSFTIDDARSRGAMQSYRSLFSGAEYQAILDLLQSQNLQFDPNGITLNNSPISVPQLQSFLNQNRQRKFSIHIEE